MESYYLYEKPKVLAGLGAQNIIEDLGVDPSYQYGKHAMVRADLSADQCKALIPIGNYCYDSKGCCPFLDEIPNFPKQDNGYCHLLKRGDWQGTGFGLLWDSCKECGINEYQSDYDE